MYFLAWRQLMARKKQSLLILLGISFGTLLFVSISGLQLGMRSYISEQLLNNTAHILIKGSDRTIDPAEVTEAFYGKNPVRWISPPSGKREESRLENYQGWYRLLVNESEVLDFSPRLTTNAILANGRFTSSVNLVGTIPKRHLRITSVRKYMKEGTFEALEGGSSNIVIGTGVAADLGVRLDQTILVSSGPDRQQPFKIVGIVHFGNEGFDKSIAYAELNHVQTLNRSPGRVSEIAVALYDIERSREMADRWRLLGRDKVQDWQEANKAFMEMIRVQDYTRYFITSAILLVAAFGIYNVLTIMISQKRREIAILRAIGYAPKRILQLVLYQGILLGIAGGLLGLGLGYLVCVGIGRIDFGFEIGGSHNLRLSYDWQIYAIAFASANLASFVASCLPAFAASRLTPMEILRSD